MWYIIDTAIGTVGVVAFIAFLFLPRRRHRHSYFHPTRHHYDDCH